MINDISVLVIEDDKSIQNFIRITLKSKGYNSVFADDGLTGISYFYANNPDIILLDLGLRILTAWRFCPRSGRSLIFPL